MSPEAQCPRNHSSEPVLVSALEHWSYCPRQCGLIHVESIWDENVFTLKGSAAHERVDEPTRRTERGKRVERGLPIWSHRHGLQGRADAVEFPATGPPVPVEYKLGRGKSARHAALQLCAQAFCLEEMFDTDVPEGFVFFVSSQSRERVAFDSKLRARTAEAIEAIRQMVASTRLPSAKYDRRCRDCSLLDACLPQVLSRALTLRAKALYEPLAEREFP